MRRLPLLLVFGVIVVALAAGQGWAAPPHIVEPYLVKAYYDPDGGSLSGTVSRARLRERCGDDDGCTIHLRIETCGSTSCISTQRKHRSWDFVTTATGELWTLHDGSGSYSTGANANGIIAQLGNADGNCSFRATSSVYKVTANPLTGTQVVACTFRVDD